MTPGLKPADSFSEKVREHYRSGEQSLRVGGFKSTKQESNHHCSTPILQRSLQSGYYAPGREK